MWEENNVWIEEAGEIDGEDWEREYVKEFHHKNGGKKMCEEKKKNAIAVLESMIQVLRDSTSVDHFLFSGGGTESEDIITGGIGKAFMDIKIRFTRRGI